MFSLYLWYLEVEHRNADNRTFFFFVSCTWQKWRDKTISNWPRSKWWAVIAEEGKKSFTDSLIHTHMHATYTHDDDDDDFYRSQWLIRCANSLFLRRDIAPSFFFYVLRVCFDISRLRDSRSLMIRLKKFGTISCEKISSYCSLCNFVFFFLLFLSLLGYRVQLLFHAAFNSCNTASRVPYIISPNNTVDILLIMHKILFSSINAMFRVSTLRVFFSFFFLFLSFYC